MTAEKVHDPFQRPPESIRNFWKKYQKIRPEDIARDHAIIDFSEELSVRQSSFSVTGNVEGNVLEGLFRQFKSPGIVCGSQDGVTVSPTGHHQIYEHESMPGFRVLPYLFPPDIQRELLDRLLHRDLSKNIHNTNVHAHYDLVYSDGSFFSLSPSSSDVVAEPLNPAIHRTLTVKQLLNKKMRWMTLGGQYRWTEKQYPDTPPPAFPQDIKAMLEGIFTDTKAEAAIVNLYTPGDTLSVHRDVAEECGNGLISVSLGCDAIFVLGFEGSAPYTDGVSNTDSNHTDCDREKIFALRLRSGSAVYMSGASRFAWHGVPQVLAGTCPSYLENWPADSEDEKYEDWRGWMKTKRVNLNVRQMKQ